MVREERVEVVFRGGGRTFIRLGGELCESARAGTLAREIRPAAEPVSAGAAVGA
jgi:hypothetical protein